MDRVHQVWFSPGVTASESIASSEKWGRVMANNPRAEVYAILLVSESGLQTVFIRG
jgi:hypothetical protein